MMRRNEIPPIVEAAIAGDVAKILGLLDMGAKADDVDQEGRTALLNAVISGCLGCVQALIAHGANLNHRDRHGWSALHFAAQSNSAALVEALVEAGADVDVQDENGNTPLFRAVFAYKGGPEAIAALLRAGADANKLNLYDVSPRILADTIANYDARRFFPKT